MASAGGAVNLTLAAADAAATMRQLIDGYQISQAISVVATLGIADLLANGPRTTDDLADASSAHEPSLYRVLRALASIGVFREGRNRAFSMTSLAACLRSDAPAPMGQIAAYRGRPYYWQAWSHLLHSVRTGENAFTHAHGTNIWDYRAQHPEERAIFDRAMTGNTRGAAEAVLAAYDFSQFACTVDVGGGEGMLLAAILAAHPPMRGILFDQPHNAAGAEAVLRAAGVEERCTVVGGSFFEAPLPQGEAYLLKMILHDWDDEASVAILQACRNAIAPSGRLLVIEQVIAPPNEAAAAKFGDLNMLVALGGQERTREEFAALFLETGFRLVKVTDTGHRVAILEGLPI
jgi:hypothetical protein